MKLLPYGVATFNRMITDGYVYVDKTKEIYDLYQTGFYYHFLSRPRRFGKSVLISTLKEFFQGNHELFKGLWIDRETTYSWPKHPVIHIDLSSIAHRTEDEFHTGLTNYLKYISQEFEIFIDVNDPESAIVTLIKELYKKKGRVAVLIDEYDKPLLDNIKNQEIVLKSETFCNHFSALLNRLIYI